MPSIECSDYTASVISSTDNITMKTDGGKQAIPPPNSFVWNVAHVISNETFVMDTLVIAQCGGWLQSYLQRWPPAGETQRGTKWPVAKIRLFK